MWRDVAPHSASERRELIKRCGSKCFLDPKNLKFPICEKCSKGTCNNCRISPAGLRAAMSRAGEWGYPQIEKKAKKMYQNRRGGAYDYEEDIDNMNEFSNEDDDDVMSWSVAARLPRFGGFSAAPQLTGLSSGKYDVNRKVPPMAAYTLAPGSHMTGMDGNLYRNSVRNLKSGPSQYWHKVPASSMPFPSAAYAPPRPRPTLRQGGRQEPSQPVKYRPAVEPFSGSFRKDRNAPAIRANSQKMGTEMIGGDGNTYRISPRNLKSGLRSRYWKKIGSSSSSSSSDRTMMCSGDYMEGYAMNLRAGAQPAKKKKITSAQQFIPNSAYLGYLMGGGRRNCTAPKKRAKKPKSHDGIKNDRPSPHVHAGNYEPGYIKTGHDGRSWIIAVSSKGVRSWKRYD
jgi:hypothetical protein